MPVEVERESSVHDALAMWRIVIVYINARLTGPIQWEAELPGTTLA